MGVPVLSPAVAGSRVLSTLDLVTPAPARTLLAELRTAALGEGIPWLVEVLEGPTEAPQLPAGGLDDGALAAASNSVVRITGTAYQCGSNLSGSGFVVAEDRIVTNAHVVAGVTEPIVEAPGQPAVQGRVVAYDDANDLALIAVSGLATPPLAIAEPASGDEVAVAGYPFGGPLEVRPARVMSIGPIVSALVGLPAGRLVDRFGPTVAVSSGLAGVLLGALSMALLAPALGVAGYVASLVLITAGYALFQAANNTAVMSSAGREQRGVASALLALARNLGLVLGASAMGALFVVGSRGLAMVNLAPGGEAGVRLTFLVAAALAGLALTAWRWGGRAPA